MFIVGRRLGALPFADRFMASTACCLFEFLDNLLSAHGNEWLHGWQILGQQEPHSFRLGNALIIGHFIFRHCSQQQWQPNNNGEAPKMRHAKNLMRLRVLLIMPYQSPPFRCAPSLWPVVNIDDSGAALGLRPLIRLPLIDSRRLWHCFL